MGRLLREATYSQPAEHAQTLTRAVFEVRVKFRLFDDGERDWAKDTIKAVMEEWGWCLQTHAEAVRVEQIPIIVGDTIHHRMIAVSLNFDTGWVNSYDVGEWWDDYIEDPDLWEGGCPDTGEFARLLKRKVRNMAGNSESVDTFVRGIEVCEDR